MSVTEWVWIGIQTDHSVILTLPMSDGHAVLSDLAWLNAPGHFKVEPPSTHTGWTERYFAQKY